jgi:hypothetical protein
VSGPLELARELEAEDARLAREIEAAAELQRRAAVVAERAAGLRDFAETLPAARERLAAELRAADEELAARQAELDRAEAALEKLPDEPEARRAAVRARDLLSVARLRLDRVWREGEALEERAAALPRETEELAREATGVTEALDHPPVTAPPPDPAALVEWGSRARAALLVARSGLDVRRERVVREANELAASVLGEPVAASVTGVRERLERRA